MRRDRADRWLEPGQQPLALAEAVAEQETRATGVGVGAPPVVDVAQHRGLRAPPVDRQPEG
jgi:hypothetical protein